MVSVIIWLGLITGLISIHHHLNHASFIYVIMPLSYLMRVGLNSGPVIVGAIGDDLRMDYTAVGDTINLGFRMESMACWH